MSAAIVSDPQIYRGKPCIAGKGVTVQDVAGDYNNGLTIEQIGTELDLSSDEVSTALTYYFAHKGQIDREIVARKEQARKLIRPERPH